MKEKALQLATRLRELEIKQADTLKSLNTSLLIQAIWPDAFKSGSVVSSGIQKEFRQCIPRKGCKWVLGFTEFWFKSRDGIKHNLSRLQLEVFKPGVCIHPDYKEVA